MKPYMISSALLWVLIGIELKDWWMVFIILPLMVINAILIDSEGGTMTQRSHIEKDELIKELVEALELMLEIAHIAGWQNPDITIPCAQASINKSKQAISKAST